jgi:hypothetical protein
MAQRMGWGQEQVMEGGTIREAAVVTRDRYLMFPDTIFVILQSLCRIGKSRGGKYYSVTVFP